MTTDLLIGTQPNRPGRPERADQTNSEPTYHGVNIRSSKLKIRILGSSSKSKMRRAVIHETLGCCFNKLSMLVAWMYSRYMSYCSRYFFSSRGLVFLNGSSCLETTDSCSRSLPVILPTVPAGGVDRAAERSILLSTALLLSSTSLKSQWGLVKLGSPCSD